MLQAFLDPVTAARAIHFGAMSLLWGVVLFRACVAWPEGGRAGRARLAWVALGVALVSGAAWPVALAAVNGDADAFYALATQTRFGQVTLARLVMLSLAAALLPRLATLHAGLADTALLGVVAASTGSLALLGHAGATGAFEAASDAVHVLAAGGWVGALAPLALALPHGDATVIARRFSRLGIASVAALAVSGAVTGWTLAGGLPGFLGTEWGRLLCLKLGLVAIMLAIAAVNRFAITPRVARSPAAVAGLRVNAWLELALGCGVIALAAALGAAPPGAHEETDWPFAWRLDPGALDTGAPASREAWLAVLAFAAAAALTGLALVWRSARTPLVGAACAALAAAAFHAPALTTRAYPTSFRTSPAPYSARSVALGAGNFAIHCAQCHGARGRGDGPLAARLTPKPPDLTQDHLFAHPDGELFWWISYGLGPMPAYGAALDPATLWSLIDFLHANADGARLRALNGRVAGPAFPLPAFAVSCPGSDAATTGDLAGSPLHIIVADPTVEPRLRQLSFLAASVDTRVIVLPAGDVRIPAGDWKPCIAEEEALFGALGAYNFTGVERLAGLELIVDARGRLRSMWNPQSPTDWRDPIAFRRALAEMKVPQELARALSAVNAAPGATGARYDTDGHRH